jgi:hypothetical protein
VTGGGPRRGPGGEPGRSGASPRDVWRGVRETSRGQAPAGAPAGSTPLGIHAEVEELPPQSVLPRGSSRLGLGGTLAVVAIVALLAAGFGVLGGRPDASPRPTFAAVAPTLPGAALTARPPASPRVTPWTECASPPTSPPQIFLQVNGEPFEGAVELASSSAAPLPTAIPAAPVYPGFPVEPPPSIEVPVDVITEIWVDGGACALAWTIDLSSFHRLDSVVNVARDLGHAAQNRFEVLLVPYAGGEFVLRAELDFGTVVAEVTWPITILPIERPRALLRAGGLAAFPALGCDVTLTFGAGRSEPLNPCVDDVGQPPGDAIPVRSGTHIEFSLDGWGLDRATVTCGRLSGQSFIAQPSPGCSHELEHSGAPLAFEAPPQNGRWTLALSACASQPASRGTAFNRVCGTWYANIAVTDD